jgi:hypothetical protein
MRATCCWRNCCAPRVRTCVRVCVRVLLCCVMYCVIGCAHGDVVPRRSAAVTPTRRTLCKQVPRTEARRFVFCFFYRRSACRLVACAPASVGRSSLLCCRDACFRRRLCSCMRTLGRGRSFATVSGGYSNEASSRRVAAFCLLATPRRWRLGAWTPSISLTPPPLWVFDGGLCACLCVRTYRGGGRGGSSATVGGGSDNKAASVCVPLVAAKRVAALCGTETKNGLGSAWPCADVSG